MKLRAALVAGTALVGAAAWLPLTSLLLHGAVPRAEPPSLMLPFPAYYYWRDYRDSPPIRRWLPPSAAGAGVLALAPALLVGCAPGRRRRLTTAEPGEPVPEVERARSGLYGDARWLTHDEARRWAAPTSYGGVVIGQDKDGGLLTDSCQSGSGHWLVFAGSGAGKTASITVPTLDPSVGWRGPVLVMDSAAEVWHMTRDVREAAGQRCFRIGLPRDDENGNPVPCHGFNVLDWIDPVNDPLATVHVETVVDLLGKERPKQSSENPLWRDSGRAIQKAILLDMLWSPKLPRAERTLARFARLVMEPEKELRSMLKDIHAESASEKARVLAGSLMEAHEKTFSGFHSNARTDVEWLLDPAFAQMVCGSSIRSDELARGDVSIYVEIPMRVLKSSPEVGRTIINALLEGVYRHEGRIASPVLAILEDVHLLGNMKALEDARDNARKYRVHLMPIWQSTGQIADDWGIGGKSSWMESSTGQIYMGVQNEHTLKEISERCGTYTGRAHTENRSTGRSSGAGGASNRGWSEGVSEVRVPLILPEKVRQLEGRIVFRGKAPPLWCGNPFWYRQPGMVGRIKGSPFRRNVG